MIVNNIIFSLAQNDATERCRGVANFRAHAHWHSTQDAVCAVHFSTTLVVNPRRACAARVTVLGSVCVCVCVCVCPSSHISLHE